MNEAKIDSDVSGPHDARRAKQHHTKKRDHLRILLLLLKARHFLNTTIPILGMHLSDVDENHPSLPPRNPAPTGSKQSPRPQSTERVQKKYRALLEGAPDAVFVADAETGEIVDANESAASLLETSVDDIIGRHQSKLHPSDDAEKYRSLFQRHKDAAEDSPATFSKLDDGSQIYVVSDNGTLVPVEISASFVDLNGEELFVGIFRDITERKRRDRELKNAKREAEEASELKSAMLANVSHEIRTPITSIIGFSKVLTQMLEGEPEEHAERIYQAGQHLMKTIHSILELSKLESGVQVLEQKSVRLDRVAEWAVELLEPQATEKNLVMETEIPETPIETLGNREALNRIAENLLENAIKFTPEGGRVEVRVWEDEQEVFLEVEDNGIGMNPDTVSALFQPFKQGSEGVARQYEGSGLGLSIVRELTNRLGGTIEVESEKGKGSRFTLRMPLPADGEHR